MQMMQLAGLSSYREGINLQPHRTTEHIVTAAEIQLLKSLEGYLCVAGNERTTVRIPERHLERRRPAFLPRSNGARAQGTNKVTSMTRKGWAAQ